MNSSSSSSLRRGGQGARQLEALAVDERELRGRHVARAAAARPARADGRPRPSRRRAAWRVAAVEPADEDVLARGEPGEGADELEGAGDAPSADPVRREPADGVAGEADLAGVGSQRAGDQVEQRGLARAVRSHDADQLALREREADVADGAHAAEALRHPRHLEEGHAAGRPTASGLSAWRTAARDTRAAPSRTPWARSAPACRSATARTPPARCRCRRAGTSRAR